MTTVPAPAPPPDPARERVTFIQHQLPGLDAGVYRLTISQHVDDKHDTRLSTEPISRDYHLAVGGDRFRLLDPAASVLSVFPASNATGEFATVLPHVVLTTPALPWIRSPETTPPPPPPPGQDTEVDVPSWLAILTLDDDDVAAYPGLVLTPVAVTTADLFPVAACPHSTLPAGGHSYFDGATGTDGLEPGQATTDPIQVIDLPLALFTDIAPTLADLALNAHVRQLSLANKPQLLGDTPAAGELGTFAIVIGNRLPQEARTSHAYLVSLAGLAAFLPGAGGTLQGTTLRLAVLAHWTFASQPGPMAFTDVLQRLNGRTPGGPDAPVTTLRLAPAGVPPAGVGAAIGAALNAGYTPLTHALRTGETTVSWYRGPLSPDGDPPPPDLDLPFSCSDQALLFDPTTGLFDASLAAAWTVGRLIALQDKAFAAALYTWKRGLTRAVVNAAEAATVAEVLGEQAPTAEESARKPLLHATVRLLARGRPG